MPKITVHADQPGNPDQMTFSERIVAAHLDDDHYAAQLVERLAWAAADAEALETQAAAAEAAVSSEPSRGRGLRHERSRQMPDAGEPVEGTADDPALPHERDRVRRRVVSP